MKKLSNRQVGVFQCVAIAGVILSWAVPQVYADVPLGEILLLGDSITYGSSTPSEVPGGYRGRLNANLKNAGYSFRFVGSQTGNPSGQLTADGQTHHEGYGSYQVDMIANNLNANNQPPGLPGNNDGYWLTGTGGRAAIYPSYVLLHIGTNDIHPNNDVGTGGADTSHLQTRLRSLITQIVTFRPKANVIVSTLIPIATNEAKYQVLDYNNAIKNTIVPEFVAQGKHVTYVDNYQNFIDQDGVVLMPLLLSRDGLHPSQEGFDLMGDTWAAGIQATTPHGNVVAAEAAQAWQPGKTVSLNGVEASVSKPVLAAPTEGLLYFPFMTRLANGDLFAAYSNHEDLVLPKRTGLVSWSGDNGLTWSPPVAPPGELLGEVSLRLPNDDTLLYPMSLYPKPGGMGSSYMVISGQKGKREIRYVKEGLTITGWPRPTGSMNPKIGVAGFQFNGETVLLPSGKYLATLYGYFEGVTRYSLVLVESRDGLNWKVRSIIADDKCKLHGAEGPDESAIIQLKDGRLMCVFRLDYENTPYGQTFSSDDGCTWTEPIAMTNAFGVQPSLAMLADGALALSGGRPGLFLWLNLDGTGKDWQQIDLRAIHDATIPEKAIENTTSYTEVRVLDDSNLIVMYDRLPRGGIWVVRVTLTKPGP